MEKQLESRKVVCRYGTEGVYLEQARYFGWELASKVLLNRFGNPLPTNVRLSESELREKCSYELTLNRMAEPEIGFKLNSLQNEYEAIPLQQTHFTGGRITGMVFLSLAIISFLITCFSNISKNQQVAIMMLVFALIAIGGFAALLVTGVFRVLNACKNNEKIEKRRKEIIDEAYRLISSK